MTIYHVKLTLFVVGKSVRYHLPELVHVVKMCQFSIDLHFINNIVISLCGMSCRDLLHIAYVSVNVVHMLAISIRLHIQTPPFSMGTLFPNTTAV
jgi:hypothetical protein